MTEIIYLGDCIDVLPKLAIKPQLILTSPPYDNLRSYDGDNSFDFEKVADAIVSVMSEGSVLVWVVGDSTVNGSETGTSFKQALGFIDRGLKLHDTMIFEKTLPMFHNHAKRYAHSFEYMFVFVRYKIDIFNPIIDRVNKSAGVKYKYTGRIMRRPGGIRDSKRLRDEPLVVKPTSMRSNIWVYTTGSSHSAPDFKRAHEHPAIFPLALAQGSHTYLDE